MRPTKSPCEKQLVFFSMARLFPAQKRTVKRQLADKKSFAKAVCRYSEV